VITMPQLPISPGMTAMTVIAELATGVASAGGWGIALDGLLAAQLWQEQKADAAWSGGPEASPAPMESERVPDLDLPLARCLGDGRNEQLWHWAATCAWPGQISDDHLDVHYWTGRLDHRHTEQAAARLPTEISERQGRYRSRRMPLLAIACRHLIWRAVGDPAAVAGLVGEISAIGKKRAQGEGQVLAWRVVPEPELDPAEAAHLHPDGSLGRPCALPCLPAGIEPAGIGDAGLRPPYMHPARRHRLALPAALDQPDRVPEP